MRIATSQYQATMNISLQQNQERISYVNQQMASRTRILLPSDDPVDTVRMSRLHREESAVGQYRDNIAALKIRLTKNEAYLGSMVNDMMQGRDLLVWSSDGGNAPADLAAMVSPLTALRESLLYSANSIDQEGRYVFSGTQTGTAPIAYNAAAAIGSRYSYAGNTNDQTVVVGNGITQVANGNMSGIETMLNQLDMTLAALSAPGASANDPTTRATLAANLDGFDTALDLISGKIAVLGGSQNILNTLDENHSNVSLSNQMALTDIGQLDYGLAATELSGYTSALEATYKAYTKIGNLSLFAAL
ncbi:flagellar hook-associated protein FlgL [Massilia pseudoviolaceinigra]|uniref:flagellar hook-associated protein FlgL n=1 Tax=Massilia pseudoviolaceinigra TaxID=3057165 RepID=UPI002796DC18|nr:flagellar hook-associated protein FlgL [Massilia sp. CCM 9206]MDQ1924894.1 flagellar hook-associated protein FlgL [Massilia sp. CCM 9206]